MSTTDVSPRGDRRQRRWLEMHASIYEAACELFLERGFAATSVDEIAERADVARKTAFNHYPRKRDFIGEWGNRRRELVARSLSPQVMTTASLRVVLEHYFEELANLNNGERALTIRMLHGWRECGGPFDADPHQLVGVFVDLLAAAKARGELAADLASGRVATMLYSTYFGLLYDWCEGTDAAPPFNLTQTFQEAVDLVLVGLLNDETYIRPIR